MNAVNLSTGNAAVGKHPGILYPLMLIAAIAVIIFSIVGIATMMGWMSGGPLSSGMEPARARPEAPSRQAAPRLVPGAAECRDCGVVESVRAVEKSANYEIRVRMSDGSIRTLYEATQPVLTVGQKVRVTEQGVVAG